MLNGRAWGDYLLLVSCGAGHYLLDSCRQEVFIEHIMNAAARNIGPAYFANMSVTALSRASFDILEPLFNESHILRGN